MEPVGDHRIGHEPAPERIQGEEGGEPKHRPNPAEGGVERRQGHEAAGSREDAAAPPPCGQAGAREARKGGGREPEPQRQADEGRRKAAALEVDSDQDGREAEPKSAKASGREKKHPVHELELYSPDLFPTRCLRESGAVARPPRIVGVGGGIRASPVTLSKLDEYVLEVTGRERPKGMYLPAPAADSDALIVPFYERFSGVAEPSHLKLFGAPDAASWRPRLLEEDVVCVSGGNTANALAVWRTHGMDVALRAAWATGIVLVGASAGMICWFERSSPDSYGPSLAPLRDGRGFLAGSA